MVMYMQPERETLTDSLASIIQILQLGQRSGTLTVERDAGQTFEEGYIVFVNGRIVDAKANQYSGGVAFNYLNTWGRCRFSFIDGGNTDAAPASRLFSLNQAPTPRSTNPLANSDVHNTRVPSPFPRRSQAGEAALANPESARLQRTHRRLLLLINGQRSPDELARLMARNFGEVQTLLNDLEQAGLIHQ